MHRLLKFCLVAAFMLAGLSLGGCNGASEAAREAIGKDGPKVGFNYRTLTRGDHVRKYGIFVPIAYKDTNKYPVIIFLNGIGEGTDFGEGDGKNMTVGIGPFVAQRHDTFDSIVIFVQSGGNWSADSVYADDVITALDDVLKAYPGADKERVSLTGLSTGGYGTYVIGAKFHDRFAAIVPMGSNGADTSVAANLTHVAVRAYCSESGDIFAGSNDPNMVDAIKTRGGKADFIPTPTSGHDCWEYVYGQSDLFDWLKVQRRQVTTPSPSAAWPVTLPIRATADLRTNSAASVVTSY